MGSPISPIVANLLVEDLEAQAIRTSTTPPTLWEKYVDGHIHNHQEKITETASYNISTQYIPISNSPVKK